MKRWNVVVTVVDVIDALSADAAIRELTMRLDKAGFDVIDDPGTRYESDAIESD
jgi:hypothetical protein